MKKLVWSFLAVLLLTVVQGQSADAASYSSKEEVKTVAITEKTLNNSFQIKKIVPPIPQA